MVLQAPAILEELSDQVFIEVSVAVLHLEKLLEKLLLAVCIHFLKLVLPLALLIVLLEIHLVLPELIDVVILVDHGLDLVQLVHHLRLFLGVLADEECQLVDGLAIILIKYIFGLEIVLLALGLALILFLFELVGVYLEDELENHFDQLRWQVHQHVRLIVFLLIFIAFVELRFFGQQAVLGIFEILLQLPSQ